MHNQSQTPNQTKMMNQTAYKPQPIIRENVVDVTFDYDAFSFLKGNRPVDEKHVRKLVESMKQEYLQRPIDVNENFEIIDGQHRFTAIKQLGLPLFYTVRKGWAIKQVQVANSNTKGWTINDIVESQSELGNPNYIAIRDFCKKHKVSVYNAISLLDVKERGTIFAQGKAKVNDIKVAEKAFFMLQTLQSLVNFRCDRRIIVYAFRKLAENKNFDFSVFLKKLEYQSDRLKPCIDVKSQINVIEEIYNYRNQNKVNLRINSK